MGHPMIDDNADSKKRWIYVTRGRHQGWMIPMPRPDMEPETLLEFASVLAGAEDSDPERYIDEAGAHPANLTSGIMYVPTPWRPPAEL